MANILFCKLKRVALKNVVECFVDGNGSAFHVLKRNKNGTNCE